MGLTGGLVQRWQTAARALKRELYALYLASRDPRTPWYAKAAIAGVLAYALSPIDLIPDFIPVLGYLDDLVLLPAGIWVALRLIPPTVMAESRARAEEAVRLPASKAGLIVVLGLWAFSALLLLKLFVF